MSHPDLVRQAKRFYNKAILSTIRMILGFITGIIVSFLPHQYSYLAAIILLPSIYAVSLRTPWVKALHSPTTYTAGLIPMLAAFVLGVIVGSQIT